MRRQEPAQIEALADGLLNLALGGVAAVSTSALSSEVRQLASELVRTLGLREVIDFHDDGRSIEAVVWFMDTAHAGAAPYIVRRWRAPLVMITPGGEVEVVEYEGE